MCIRDRDDVKLTITDDALLAIAEKALQRKIGARGLRAIMEEILEPIMYELPSEPDVYKRQVLWS